MLDNRKPDLEHHFKNGIVFGSYKRTGAFPLDASSVINEGELLSYLQGNSEKGIPYNGQIIAVKSDNSISLAVLENIPEKKSDREEITDTKDLIKYLTSKDELVETVIKQVETEAEKLRVEIETKYATINALSDLKSDLADFKETAATYATKAQVDELDKSINQVKADLTQEITESIQTVEKKLSDLLGSDVDESIDSFTEVRNELEKIHQSTDGINSTIKEIQDSITKINTETGKQTEIDALKAELGILNEKFNNLDEDGFATDEELEKAISEAVNKLLGADLDRINEAYNTIKEIAEWIEEHGSNFQDVIDATAGLKDDVTTLQGEVDVISENLAGIKNRQDSQQTTINGLINTSIPSLEQRSNSQAEEIRKQRDDINEVIGSITDQELRLQKAESDLSNLSGNYVTRDELNSLVGNIAGVEKTVVLSFANTNNVSVYNRTNDVIPANSIIREIEVLFETAAKELPAEPKGTFISIQKGEVKSDLIKYQDIDDEVVTDQEQLPETFIFTLNKMIDTDSKIVVEPVDFFESTGKVFVKYYKN